MVDLHGVFGLDPPALGHVAVDLFDAALGVLAVAAHVPLAHRAVRAWDGVGAADDADHEIALREPTGRAWVHHAAERFMAQHQARLAGRRPAVLPFHDFHVGPTDPDSDGSHQDRTIAHVRLGDVFQLCRSRFLRLNRDGLHASPLSRFRCITRERRPSVPRFHGYPLRA